MTNTILRVLGWLGVAAIGVLSLVPGEARPHTMLPSQMEHVAAYFATAATLALAHPGRRSLWVIAVSLSVYAGLLETAQLWIPGRMARVIDVVAGSFGAWTGASVAQLGRLALSSRARPGPT